MSIRVHPKKLSAEVFLVILISSFFLLASSPACFEQTPRPATWAQPIKATGVPNLHKVSDLLYRSAQPTAAGFKELEKLGIKTIIDLTGTHQDPHLMAGTSLKYYDIPSKASEVREGDLLHFLKILTNPAEGPYLVHCHHGADRTGLFVAVYRIVAQGWSKEEAILEMQKGDFGFHNTYTNIVKYLQAFEPEKFRQALSLTAEPERSSLAFLY
jgi:protein tyrosine/serine phosphatase